MYIERPQLLEAIRESILEKRITYIYGAAGVGKTTLCNQCIDKYFSDRKIHRIQTFSLDIPIISRRFDEGIYIFENFIYSLDENLILDISRMPANKDTRFIFISRSIYQINKEHIIEQISPFICIIEITPPSNMEMAAIFKDLYSLYSSATLDKVFGSIQGNVLVAHELGHLLLQQKFKEDNINILYKPCIIDKYGNAINKIDNSTKIAVTEVNDQLLCDLAENPELLHNLSPYNFERVIARMFEKKGFTVKITPQTRDGGKDIFVAKNDLLSFLFYVECKKYTPNRPVGIEVIQRLYGVISAENATGGIIATTSHFTKSAKDYVQERQLEHRLKLQDYNIISDILKSLQYKIQ